MDELRNLVQAKLLGSLAKHEEHGVNDIGLSTSIWTCKACEHLIWSAGFVRGLNEPTTLEKLW